MMFKEEKAKNVAIVGRDPTLPSRQIIQFKKLRIIPDLIA